MQTNSDLLQSFQSRNSIQSISVQLPTDLSTNIISMIQGPEILVVEDEILIARELETNLTQLGYNVVGIAVNGDEAIDKAIGLQPDLILMDIILPGSLDGIEATERIHQVFSVPVIYISAYDDATILRRAKATQPFGYLVKPFNDRSLRATIEVALELSKVSHQTKQIIAAAQSQPEPEDLPKKQELTPMLQNYLGIAAHEIGNSLGIIQVNAELLNEMAAPPLLKQQAIERIQKAAFEMNWLRDDLLILAQTGTERYAPQRTNIELVGASQQLIEMLSAQQMQNRLKLLNQQEAIVAPMDERLLNYLLKNLLLNALKYSPEDTPVLLILDRKGNQVELQIKDQGIGIPSDYHPYIFQPFQRASNAGRMPGVGLGLAIVKRCVDLLQGKITLDSEVGRGTTFKVILPVA